ncbi:hypothetical protein LTR72_008624 [Exophiala xenobiotica]|nr:hypothetical protein LTR72_008624 [Exophiala xenobiotica]KAK5319583.1 hypothetical protein LTR93_007503 [Exophiala xenobiotica]KAK5459217.1 hypothetical protein LTR20_007888 [Exophiala xenobiotica]KAK5480116.1 hypothetical protein LTR55_007479 [Exophiala xenobiotica]KAK5509560.1 hypothetical protein LTR21_007750 [Exophiala xenobiotica]
MVRSPHLRGSSSSQALYKDSSGHIQPRSHYVSDPRECFQGYTGRRPPSPPSTYQLPHSQRLLHPGARQRTLNPLAPDFTPSPHELLPAANVLDFGSAFRWPLPNQLPFNNLTSFAPSTDNVPVASECPSDKPVSGRGRPCPFVFTAQEDFDDEAHYYAVNRSNFELLPEVVFRWPRDVNPGASQAEHSAAPALPPMEIPQGFRLPDSQPVQPPSFLAQEGFDAKAQLLAGLQAHTRHVIGALETISSQRTCSPQASEDDTAASPPQEISSAEGQLLPDCDTVQGLRMVQTPSVRSLVFTVQDEPYAEIQFNAAAAAATMDFRETEGFADRPVVDSARLAWLSITGTGYPAADDISRILPLSFPPLRDRTSLASTDSSTSTSATVDSYSTATTSIYNPEGASQEPGPDGYAAVNSGCSDCSDTPGQAERHVPASPSEGSSSDDSDTITQEAFEQRSGNINILDLASAHITFRPPRTRDRQLSPTSEQRMRHEIQQAHLRLDAFEAGPETASSLDADTQGLGAIQEEDELAESEALRDLAKISDPENIATAGPVVMGGLERIEEETEHQVGESPPTETETELLAVAGLDDFQDASGVDETASLPGVGVAEHALAEQEPHGAEGYDSETETEPEARSGESGVTEAFEPRPALPSPAPTDLSMATTMLPPPSPATLVDEPLRHLSNRQVRLPDQAIPLVQVPPRGSSALRARLHIPPPRVHPLQPEVLQILRDTRRRAANPPTGPLTWAPAPSGPFSIPPLNLAPLHPHLTLASQTGDIAEPPPRAPGHTATRTVPLPRVTPPEFSARNGQTFEEAAEEYMASLNPAHRQHRQTPPALDVCPLQQQQTRRVPSNGDISNVARSATTEHRITTDRVPTAHPPGPRSCLRSNRRVFAGAHINGHPPVDIADALTTAKRTEDAKAPKTERPVPRRVRFAIPSCSPTSAMTATAAKAAPTASMASPTSSMETLRRCLAERDAPAPGDPQSQSQSRESQVAARARLACTKGTDDDETIQPVPDLPTFTRLPPRLYLGAFSSSSCCLQTTKTKTKTKKTKQKLPTRRPLTQRCGDGDEIRDGDGDGNNSSTKDYEDEESLQPLLLPTGTTAALRRVGAVTNGTVNSLDCLKEKAKGLLKKGADKIRELFR